MKAKLLRNNNELHLLLCNGKIKKLNLHEARKFLETYDDESHYVGSLPATRDVQKDMAEYLGTPLATVEDDNLLQIHDSEFFRSLLSAAVVSYIGTTEYAEKHNKKPAIVRRLCMDGRFEGAFVVGKTWLLPEDAPYPEDARVGKRVQRLNKQ